MYLSFASFGFSQNLSAFTGWLDSYFTFMEIFAFTKEVFFAYLRVIFLPFVWNVYKMEKNFIFPTKILSFKLFCLLTDSGT